ncbi:hypothetical protein TNCV_4887981 [Trichonephila clavipes]|nr:hypothetical protein TNCV_4887981 [Trichonephila clavipes]
MTKVSSSSSSNTSSTSITNHTVFASTKEPVILQQNMLIPLRVQWSGPKCFILKYFKIYCNIVRVQYFVRGGFVGHRSRASSKHHLFSSSGRRARFLGVKQGLRCTCKMHVWVSGPQRKPTRCRCFREVTLHYPFESVAL